MASKVLTATVQNRLLKASVPTEIKKKVTSLVKNQLKFTMCTGNRPINRLFIIFIKLFIFLFMLTLAFMLTLILTLTLTFSLRLCLC